MNCTFSPLLSQRMPDKPWELTNLYVKIPCPIQAMKTHVTYPSKSKHPWSRKLWVNWRWKYLKTFLETYTYRINTTDTHSVTCNTLWSKYQETSKQMFYKPILLGIKMYIKTLHCIKRYFISLVPWDALIGLHVQKTTLDYAAPLFELQTNN